MINRDRWGCSTVPIGVLVLQVRAVERGALEPANGRIFARLTLPAWCYVHHFGFSRHPQPHCVLRKIPPRDGSTGMDEAPTSLRMQRRYTTAITMQANQHGTTVQYPWSPRHLIPRSPFADRIFFGTDTSSCGFALNSPVGWYDRSLTYPLTCTRVWR